MALCNSNRSHFQFLAIRIAFFLLLIYPAYPISFNITCFNNNSNILYKGDAHAADNVIQLTGGGQVHKNFSGQAVYRKPMHLWDKASNRTADFRTSFSFALDSGNEYLPGDRLTFFLVQNGSSIPSDSFAGFPVLVNDSHPINSMRNQVVAVDFYNHLASWDPDNEHVGININSVSYEKRVAGPSIVNQRFNALVWYDSSTKDFCVVLTDQANYTALSGNITFCSVVDFGDHLPEWVSVGFSAATRNSTQIHTIYSWQFNSSFKGDDIHQKEPSADHSNFKEEKKTQLELVAALGACVAIFLIGGSILFLWLILRRKRNRGSQSNVVIVDSSIDDDFVRSGPKRYSYSELEQATHYFAEEGKLGEGGFGSVYRGVLGGLNIPVAVKRVSKGSKQGRKEYESEVKIISSLRHRNLVQLLGWCHERGEFLLVYEFMPNCSLDSHLFLGKSLLAWGVRYKIALGLASALLYLHEGWEQCVVHRDIKSSNVMLDTNFNTKLGDFGLARLIDHELGPKTTGLAGTWGYMAPEYISTGKASKESDMYSFGVVALEIACGRRAIGPDIEESQARLVAWVWELYGNGNLFDAVDQRLCADFDMQQMESLMIVGLWCAHPDHSLRPSIRQAVQVLNFEAGVPNLPMTMPVAIYHVPSSSISSSEGLMTFTSASMGR